MSLPTNILVAIDFSDNAKDALDYAVALAARLDARVHLVNVVAIPVYGLSYFAGTVMNEILHDNQRELDKLVAERAALAPFGPTLLATGDARDEINAAAAAIHADLIVMGTHGRRGFSRWLLGSVAESVVRTAPCPVLLIRSGAS